MRQITNMAIGKQQIQVKFTFFFSVWGEKTKRVCTGRTPGAH